MKLPLALLALLSSPVADPSAHSAVSDNTDSPTLGSDPRSIETAIALLRRWAQLQQGS